MPQISDKLKISKSTVYYHLKSVKIPPKSMEKLKARMKGSQILRERNIVLSRKVAKREIRSIERKDLIIIASILYWAEGAKKDFTFTNTDPEMVKVFVFILREVYGIRNDDLKISLRLYEDLDELECRRFWSNIIGLSLGENTSINVLFGSKKGKLKYGMCRVRVRKSGQLLKEFNSVKERAIEIMCPRSSMDRTRDS